MSAYVGARCGCGGALKFEVERVLEPGDALPDDVVEWLHGFGYGREHREEP